MKKKIAKTKSSAQPRKEGEDASSESPPKVPSDGGNKPEKPPGLNGSGNPSESGGRPVGEPLDHLMQEAAALMKSLRPSVKAVRIAKAHSGELVTGLLDGGATKGH